MLTPALHLHVDESTHVLSNTGGVVEEVGRFH